MIAVCCSLVSGAVNAQAEIPLVVSSEPDDQPFVRWTGFGAAIEPEPYFTPLLDFRQIVVSTISGTSALPSPYSYQHLGIFCKAEVKMNQWFPIPVMVRLGDVQRAEELDGKGADHGPR